MHSASRVLPLVAPALLGITAFANPGSAQINSLRNVLDVQLQIITEDNINIDSDTLTLDTSVSKLSDIKSSEWAFTTLKSLIERYSCIAGYPDGTFKGNHAISRSEFAAFLNTCLDNISAIIIFSNVATEDLVKIRQLQKEFSVELEAIRGRVDSLKSRADIMEVQQFSTTTRLSGELIFLIADTFGAKVSGNSDQTQTIVADRVRFYLNTSFTGKENLHVGLQANNITPFRGQQTGTNTTRLAFDGNNNNNLELFELSYRSRVNDKLKIEIDVYGIEPYDSLISTLTPIQSSGSGAISRFGRFNPVFRTGSNGTGITFDYKLGNSLNFQGTYQTGDNSNNPSQNAGLFGSQYKALGQFVYTHNSLTLGLTYAHAYYPNSSVNVTGSTGSVNATDPFAGLSTSVDSISTQLQYRLNSNFILGGWFGAQFANAKTSTSKATIVNGAGYLVFQDLGSKGSLGAIVIGVPPKVTYNDIAIREDKDISIHMEAFYRYKLNERITITPGVVGIFNPEHNNNNDTIWLGVLRTTFKF